MRKIAIKAYFSKKCNDGASTSKDFWNCMKPFLSEKNCRNDGSIILKESSKIINESTEVANVFNDYFIDIAKDIGNSNSNLQGMHSGNLEATLNHHSMHPSVVQIKEDIHRNSEEQFEFSKVSVEIMVKKFKSIHPKKAAGYDRINPEGVKMCSLELAQPMTRIVNNAFQSNTFPGDMKKSEIAPIFKKSDHMRKENYRPVNLITVFAKVFESIIADQINNFMTQQISKKLGAYRKGHGCSQVLTLAVNSWKWALDKNEYVGALLMDLSKAFDSIPHDLLLCKMNAYGFSQNSCEFMLSYLFQRMQRVKIKSARSEWKVMKRGIPQGSCLGPLLFNLFLNDVFFSVELCELFNYADDNTLSSSGSDIDQLIQNLLTDTNIIIQWFHQNFMKVNPDKFQLMLMKPQSKNDVLPNEIQIDGIVIKASKSVRLLGIDIDCDLNFNGHVKKLCTKANRQLKVLYRFKNILGQKEKQILYKTFVMSTFNFCPVVWYFCGVTNIRKIEKVQERALRFLTNDYVSTYLDLLQKTNQTTLLLSRLKAMVNEVYKCIYQLNPKPLNELFVLKENKYDLRDPYKIAMPSFNKVKYGKSSFTYYGSHLWNSLPPEYKQCIEYKTFKTMISKWEGPNCQCNLCSILTVIT